MLVLDTDHLSLLGDPTPAAANLAARLAASGDDVLTTVISIEENLHGWLARIHRAKTPDDRIVAYTRFQRRVEFFADWVALPWDSDAERILAQFRSQKIRIGTQDLKIAAITLAHDATLLTRNSVDFYRGSWFEVRKLARLILANHEKGPETPTRLRAFLKI